MGVGVSNKHCLLSFFSLVLSQSGSLNGTPTFQRKCHLPPIYAPNLSWRGILLLVCVLNSIHPSVHSSVIHLDACHILWTMHGRVLKFHIWILHEKITDPYFFSCPSYLLFWSYALLKSSRWNLVSKISRKLFELGAWTWSADWGWWVDYLIIF